MSAADDVKEAFSGTRGKVLLIGGGLAIAAYVWWTRSNTGTPEPVDPEAVVTEGSARVPQTDPEVGNTSTGSTSTRPETNAGWLSDGTDFLIGRGTPASTAYNVLNKALGGEQLTDQEKALVSQVITAIGSPPDGMPPLASTPSTPSQSNTVKTAPTNLRIASRGQTTFLVDWTKVANAVGYRVTVSGGGLKSPKVYYPLFDWNTVAGLKRNTEYTISVCGRNPNGTMGPTATIKARTNK